ncbi:hypothetical protein [Haloarcula halophila]
MKVGAGEGKCRSVTWPGPHWGVGGGVKKCGEIGLETETGPYDREVDA